MSFAIFVVFVALTYLKPIEFFELGIYQTMLWLAGVAMLVAIGSARPRSQASAKRVPVALLAMLIVAIVGSLLSQQQFGLAMKAFVSFGPTAVAFYLTVVNVDSLRRLEVTCAVIAASTVLLVIAGIAAYHTGFMVEKLVVYQMNDAGSFTSGIRAEDVEVPAEDHSGLFLWRIRFMGFLADPNDFAQAMVMALPMLVALYDGRRKLRSAVLLGVPAAILVYGIYLTQSRGGILGLGALVFLAMARKVGTVISSGLLGTVAIAALSSGYGARKFSASEESAGGRIDAWAAGLEMLKANPLFGVGAGRFTEFFNYTAHNSFVLGFSELGLVGYAIWMGVLVIAFRSLNRALTLAPRGAPEYRWATMLRASLVGFLVCAFFLSRTYVVSLFILLALCIAAGHVARVRFGNEDVAPTPPWKALTAGLTVGTVLAVFAIVRVKNAGLLNL